MYVIDIRDQLVLNKNTNEITSATYIETYLDDDEDLDDLITIPYPKKGDYQVRVIVEPDAVSEDTYSLKMGTVDKITYSADNVKISDIPNEPYILTVSVPKPRGGDSNTVVIIIATIITFLLVVSLALFAWRRRGQRKT